MTRAAVLLAGAIGLALVARAAMFYRGVDPLAYPLVILIGIGLVLGVIELLTRASFVASLARAIDSLASSPTRADVDACPSALRTLLGARLVGMPSSVGAAVFTPYLLGLLVMLGLLGTFMGLFETLRGAREALTASGDVTALREGLAAPMKGLSRAFGTSAAGVSASAMLGLAAVFVRRAESRVTAKLASLASGSLFPLTLAGRQIAALEALVENRDALPRAAKAMEKASLRLQALEKSLVLQQSEASSAAALAFQSAATEIRTDVRAGVALAAEAVAPLLDRAVSRASEVASAELSAWSRKLDGDADARRAEERAHRDELARVAAAGLGAMAAVERERLSELDQSLGKVVARVTDSLTSLTEREEATALALTTRIGEVIVGVERAQKRADERETKRLEAVGDAATRMIVELERAVKRTHERDGERLALVADAATQMTLEIERAQERADERDAKRLLAIGESATRIAVEMTAVQKRVDERDAERLGALGEAATRMVVEIDRASKRADERDVERLLVVGDVTARIEARAKDFSETMAAHAERVVVLDAARAEAAHAVLGSIDEKLDHHLAALGASLAGPLTEAARATQAGPEAVARLVEAERDRLAMRESSDRDRDARFDALLSSLDSVSSALVSRSAEQAERLADFDSRLGRERDATALVLAEKLSAHAQGVGESLQATASMVRDAVGLVHAGGTEMTAVAEMFTGAVDRYCGASEKWLDSLSTIEAAVEKKGQGGEPVDLLGAYLDQTREVFDHSLAFQRELFTELRALRARTSE